MSTLHVPPDVTPIAPTVCMNWLICPSYGYLSKYWEPVGEWTPNRLLGVAVGRGLEVLLGDKRTEAPSPEDAILATLVEGYQEQDNWPLDALQALALKGYRAACKTVIKDIQEREKVLATELDVGGARIDLVTTRKGFTERVLKPGEYNNPLDIVDIEAKAIEPSVDLIVTDYKTKLQCKPEWVTRDLLESESDWQLWDYAWRVGEYYSRPVTHKRRIIIVLSPTAKAYVHETLVTEAGLNAWLRGAKQEWSYIAALQSPDSFTGVTDLPMRTTSCYGRYGKCKFYEACWSAERDPERMKVLYVEK